MIQVRLGFLQRFRQAIRHLFSDAHALASARLVNETQPSYLATLVLTFYKDRKKFDAGFDNRFEELGSAELCSEIRRFIDATELESTIYRSDHASNHLVLKGVLGRDKARLLNEIDDAIEYFENHPGFEHGNFGY